MASSEWRWKVEGDKLVPVMTDKSPAPDALIQIIHCNYLEGCDTRMCTYRKHVLECTSADGNCDNMNNDPVTDDDDEDE